MTSRPPVSNGCAVYHSSLEDSRSPADSEGSDDQFFDMLAQLQDDRLDDQRCGLPDKSEGERSGEQTSVPMVILPEKGYWCDGWTDGQLTDVDSKRRVADLRNSDWEIKREGAPMYYRMHFMNKDHENYYCEDEKLGPVLMSLRCELSSNQLGNTTESWEEYRVIVRTSFETKCQILSSAKFASSDPRAEEIAKMVLEQPSISRMHPATSEQAPDIIAQFDEHGMQSKHKFGIVFQRVGQTTEEEMFGNENHGAAMEEFLDLLGEQVQLQGFRGYAGGLDIKNGTTGDMSVYTTFQDREIMFHVSTLLPFKEKGDNQQLERKRHIGNDIVAIVFQNDETPFIAGSITSQFLQAVVIVQVVEPVSDFTRYKLSVVAKDGVSNFGPTIPETSVFRKDEHFRSWLLTKMVNAETAAKETPQFTKLQLRTRTTLLQNLVAKLKEIEESDEDIGEYGRLVSKVGSSPSLGSKKQRHSIDTGVLSHSRSVSLFAATESHDLVMRRQRSGDSPLRPHVYKPLYADPGQESVDDDVSQLKREQSKIRRQHLLNRVQHSLHSYQKYDSSTLPAGMKLHSQSSSLWKKSVSSSQLPSSDNSSTEDSPIGSLSSVGIQPVAMDSSGFVMHSAESGMSRGKRHSYAEGKYGTTSSASSLGMSNHSPLSESEEDNLLRMIEALQREVDKLREERLRLLRETVTLKRENTDLKKRDLERDKELRAAYDELSQLRSEMASLRGEATSDGRDAHASSSSNALWARSQRSKSADPLISRYQPAAGSRDPHRFDALLGRGGTRSGGSNSSGLKRISLSDLEGETTYL